MKFILSLLLLTLLLFATEPLANQYDTSNCQGGEELKWNKLVKKYSNDINIQELHALWLGLCIKVKRHELTSNQADIIFSIAQERVVKEAELKDRNNHEREL